MLDKKTVRNILLEVEARCYGYEKYLQDVIDEFDNDNNDIKHLITRENDNMWLCVYSYSEGNYMQWLYDNFGIDEIDEVKFNYEIKKDYVQQNYINYNVQDNILNYINIRKFRKALYNNEKLLNNVRGIIYSNIRNYANEYLAGEYKLNKYLYSELLKIKKAVAPGE